MSKREYLKSIPPAGIAAAAMVGAVLITKHSVFHLRPWLELILESAVGAAVYTAVLMVFFRPRVRAFAGLLRGLQTPQNTLPAFGNEIVNLVEN
jgi:hypothetical protein